MRRQIARRLDILNANTQLLLDWLEQQPPDALALRPSAETWSALQALNHIYLGEKLSLQYVNYKLSKGDRFPLLRPDAWLRTRALSLILRSRLKFKSPKPINMQNDQPVLSVREVSEAWQNLRMELRTLLEQHEEKLRCRMAYKQPYAGRMTLSQMLCFFRDHLRHHDRQIREILKKSEHPDVGDSE